jgi:hypothetical protein
MPIQAAHLWTILCAGLSVSVSTPKTAVQYAAHATRSAQLEGLIVTQAGSTTSAQEKLKIGVISVPGTSMIAGAVGTNIFRHGDLAETFYGQLGTALTGIGNVSSAEPTYTDTPYLISQNVLNGWWMPPGSMVPKFIPAGTLIGVQLQGIIAGTWDVNFFVRDLG